MVRFWFGPGSVVFVLVRFGSAEPKKSWFGRSLSKAKNYHLHKGNAVMKLTLVRWHVVFVHQMGKFFQAKSPIFVCVTFLD